MKKRNQKKEGDQKKKPLKVLFSVDDVHPEIGYGLYKNHDNLSYLRRLHDEFKLKFTLFMVPIWEGDKLYDIREHKDWIKWLQDEGFYSIECHGFWHKSENPELQHLEFFHMKSPEDMHNRLSACKQVFQECGIETSIFKTPGWLHDNFIYELLPACGFRAIADHVLGEVPIILSNGLVQLPYNTSADVPEFGVFDDVLILHSHINVKGGNENGWTEQQYEKVKNFLIELQKTRELVPLSFNEYLEEKNGKN